MKRCASRAERLRLVERKRKKRERKKKEKKGKRREGKGMTVTLVTILGYFMLRRWHVSCLSMCGIVDTARQYFIFLEHPCNMVEN